MALTAAQLNSIYENVLFRPAEPAAIAFYANRTDVSDAQIRQQIELSQEAVVFTNPVIRLFETAFNRLPTQADLRFYGQELKAGLTTEQVATQLTTSAEFAARVPGGLVTADFVQTVYQDLLNRAAGASEVAYYTARSAAQLVNGVANSPEATQAQAANVITFLDSAAVGNPSTGDLDVQTGPSAGGTIFNLTTGLDSGAAFTGTAGSDTFNAADVGGTATFSAGDNLNGGAGIDTLNIAQAAAFTGLPAGASVTAIENVNITSALAVTIDTTTSFAGLTNLTTNSVGAATVTATNTQAVSSIVSAQAGGAISVNGGSSVTVASTGQTTGTITVGNTAAPTGAVKVTVAGAALVDGAGATTQTQGAIAVTGGTNVNISSTGSVSGGSNNAGDVLTLGAVTVTGTAATTAVTVAQTAAQTRVATAAGVTGRAAIVDGTVTINDANSASATAAGSIAAVALGGFGAGSTINSGALSTLNLSGTGVDLTVTQGSLTTPTITTQALNVSGLTTTGAVTLGAPITTLNLTSTTTASTLANLTAAGVTTLNIAGDAKVALTTDTFAALTNVVVTNTAGATLGTALAAGTSFTGGAGADVITLSNAFTKAITLGAGNDTVTYGGAAGVGGSVAAGDGVDAIVMTAAQAAAASADATFNTKFSGFEVLGLTTSVPAATIDLAGINGVNQVVAFGQTDTTINGFTSGGTLTLTGASTSETIGVTNAALVLTDSFNIGLNNSTAATVAFGAVNVANIENINIKLTDTGTAANTAATIDTLTLVDVAVKSIVVSGNNGLTLTNAGNVNVTSFDASGVVGNDALDTAANLAVTYTSVTTGTAAVSITGGAGDDVLSGNAATTAVNTITGGLGADTITGGGGNDIIILTEATAARDTVVFRDFTTNGVDTISSFTAGTAATADNLKIVTAASTAGGATFGESTNTTLTIGAQNFALTGASTTTNAVVEVNATLSSFGNLGAANVVDGTELLKALSSNNVAASAITSNTAGDNFYLVAYQNNNAYVYQVAQAGAADTNVTASEIHLVGITTGVAAGAFVANNFTA
ncbi:DUF4214 domain-containing protein [Methylobacterium sp. WL69]|uniref:DUF4214 domain-containing protein n=1 Tax=Methylobacterium sp. WL69 TaxID=2603893 RepID=UPI0011C94285|nr:DUF4214 domain-containing protein [Methylobacterium sp. WL69]TXM71529.1 DUF4214 domain-containing protein [Methylobacterium sp. WL69]